MPVIDTHCHASPSWFEPLSTLLFLMEQNGVDRAVLVQHRGEYDNGYLLECARANPGRFSVMGLVDGSRPDAAQTLSAWQAKGVGSVRLTVPGEAGGGDPPSLWRAAAELGMPVSTLSNAPEVTSERFVRLIEELSTLPVILEHYGFLGLPETQWEEGYRELLKLARYPNVYMKVHGFGELMPRPFPARHPAFDLSQAPDHIDRAMEAFGAGRLMLATDYPPSSSREGYGNVVGLLKEYLGRWSSAEQESVLGGTAAALFSFDTP